MQVFLLVDLKKMSFIFIFKIKFRYYNFKYKSLHVGKMQQYKQSVQKYKIQLKIVILDL